MGFHSYGVSAIFFSFPLTLINPKIDIEVVNNIPIFFVWASQVSLFFLNIFFLGLCSLVLHTGECNKFARKVEWGPIV